MLEALKTLNIPDIISIIKNLKEWNGIVNAKGTALAERKSSRYMTVIQSTQ